jgi:hypothetical protein
MKRILAMRGRVGRAAAWVVATLLAASFAAAQGPAGSTTARPVEAAARELLQQYSAALETLDAEAVRKVQPSIDVQALRKAFAQMRELDVVIDDVKVLSSDAAVARVGCRVTQTLMPKAGSKRTTAVTRVMRLRRQAGGWVIDAFER